MMRGPRTDPAFLAADDYASALVNILEDFAGEKARLQTTQNAVLNILDDFRAERVRLETVQKAVLNVLEDFSDEKHRLESTQRAVLNILEDLEVERARLEKIRRELLESQEDLTRSNAELEQFAYVASHDLQEPLRMVTGYLELIERRYGDRLDDRGHVFIGYAVDGAVRMRALITDLLAYSRVGRRDTARASIDVTACVREALANLGVVIEETHAVVTYDALPTLVGSATQLTTLFQNLLANGLKFRGGEAPRIHVSAERDAGAWLFRVRDNGIGIAAEYHQRIFTIFQRLHTRAEYPGTGIGLAICRKVVERHGGRIWVESEPGQGSSFCFTLPATEERQR